MGIIPTKLHGLLDYSVGVGLMAAPRLLKFDHDRRAALVPMAAGASALIYSLLTDYELGARRIIPMPAHLALDAASGAFMAASPWLLGFSGAVWKPHVALGLTELLVVALSQRAPRRDEARDATFPPASSPAP